MSDMPKHHINEVKEILMGRDGMKPEEADELISEVREMIYEANGDIFEIEDILMDNLGLEMDYIFDLI